MKKRIKKMLLKKEDGLNGLVMAAFFMSIMFIVILYAFGQFNLELYVVEETLETGLHTSLSSVISANQLEYTEENDRETDKSLNRTHIILNATANNVLTDIEKKELKTLGNNLTEILTKTYGLKNQVYPTNGILYSMCKNKPIEITEVYIYEPIYEINYVSTEDTSRYPMGIRPEYKILGWVKYTLHFQNNVYDSGFTTKEYYDLKKTLAPTLLNGNVVEGATIEGSITANIKGVNNIFNMEDSAPEIDGKYYVSPLFSKEVQTNHYQVTVTQAVDVVISENDSRQQ